MCVFASRYHAITMGIDDLLLTPAANAERQRLMKAATSFGPAEAANYTNCDVRDLGQLRFNLV